MANKNLALLTLQSLICLPVLVFLPKGTVIFFVVAVICGLLYVRSRPDLRPLALWGLLILLGAASAIWSITPGQSIERAAKIAVFLILLGGLIHVASRWNDQDRRIISELGLKAWWLSLALVLPILVFETEVKSIVALMAPPDQSENLRLAWKPISNAAVIILVVTGFPMLGHALSTGRSMLTFLLSLAGLLVAILVSGSTSALLGMVVGFVVWFLYSRYTRPTARILAVALPLAVLAMPVLVHPLANNPEPIARSIPNFPNSFIHRLLIWDFTLERIAERPILGWGLDTSRAIPGGTDLRHIHYVVPWSDKPITHPDQNLPLHPHNAVLQIWLELGLLGVLITMLGVWKLWRTQVVSRHNGPMAGFIVCVMAIYCVAYGLMQSWWLALLFLGWAAAKAAEPKEPQPKVGR